MIINIRRKQKKKTVYVVGTMYISVLNQAFKLTDLFKHVPTYHASNSVHYAFYKIKYYDCGKIDVYFTSPPNKIFEIFFMLNISVPLV